ncbi:MAG: aminoacyl-tRNA hydrolase [Deltaproteobacteria bacterium]|nr:aminoacyl-tRNA hydrolase [Deltaproteobacteria bacterium]
MIIGLGNPGTVYKNSRHNLGFKTVDLLCAKLGLHLSDQRFQTLSTSTNYHNKKILLACPQTFMNRSGIAVKHLFEYYRPDNRNIMVIHDDIDLDAGRIKIACGGGAGGHHGVESVAYHLGTNEFCRTKIGIGRPRYNEAIEDFVLDPFYDDQQATITEALHIAVKAIESFVLYGVEAAMNTFNSLTTRKKLRKKEVKR